MIGALLAVAVAALGPGATGAAGPPAAGARSDPIAKLERAVAPRKAVVRRAEVVVGHSAEGRPIRAVAANGLGTSRNAPLVLAFGCIHGDECAGSRAMAEAFPGCPPYGDGLITVENLNPDGRALDTRLNADGVDLNRNFATDWRPIGVPGDPEHSGAHPFSEPETQLARRLIRRLHPDVTLWFHQQAEPLVRAWGPSVPAARAYARLSGLPFRRMPWMDGTAPNWQNHAFPGSSSFVVELPSSGPVNPRRFGFSTWQLAGRLMGARVLHTAWARR